MKITGNLSLGFAFLLFVYQLIPNLPGLRAAIMRSNIAPLEAVYVLGFVLVPQFLRVMIATFAMWGMLIVTLVAAIRFGGLDWIGTGRLFQCLLIGAACVAMAEITVLIGLTNNDPTFSIPGVVKAISPWAGWALPLIVMSFALVTINPSLGRFLSPWTYRGPLIAAFVLALPLGAVLFVRWVTPPAPVASVIP
jgi:hypothetical protein